VSLPLRSPEPAEDALLLGGRLLRVRITRVDGAVSPADGLPWKLSIVAADAPATAGLEPQDGGVVAQKTLATVPGDLGFTLGESHAAGPLPALLGLVRHPGTLEARTAAFGAEGDTRWTPQAAGDPPSGIVWAKHGQFDDFIPTPADPDAPAPDYRLVVLQGDGSHQFVPKPA